MMMQGLHFDARVFCMYIIPSIRLLVVSATIKQLYSFSHAYSACFFTYHYMQDIQRL